MIRDAIIDKEIGYSLGVTARKGTRGGWRPGAGRKPVLKNRFRFTVHLEKEDIDSLRDEAEAKEISLGQLIRQVLATHLRRRRK
jgi:hypothetical protein